MKNWTRAIMLTATAVALTFSSCGEKKDKTTATGTGETPTTAPIPVEIPELGFVNQLPADTAIVGAFYNIDELWQKIRSSSVAHALAAQAGMNIATDAAIPVTPQELMFTQVLGKEVVVAQYGASAENLAKLFQILVKLEKENQALQMNMLQSIEGGMADTNALSMKMGKVFSVLAGLEKVDTAPTILAFKNDKNGYDILRSVFDSSLADLAKKSSGALVPAEQKVGESTYSGYKLDGTALEALLKKQLESSSNDTKELAPLIESLKSKNLCLLLGKKGDYSIIFLGKEPSELKFAESPEKSAAASPDLQFALKYKDKKAMSFSYASKDIVKTFFEFSQEYNKQSITQLKDMGGTLLAMANIQDTDNSFKNAVTDFADKTSAFYDYIYSSEPTPIKSYGWWDKGYNVDILTSPAMVAKTANMEKPLAFSAVANLPSTILFYEAVSNEQYSKMGLEVVYSLGGVLQSALEVAASSESLAQLSPMVPVLAGPVTTATRNIGASMKKALSEGIGSDMAIVISSSTAGSQIPVNVSSLWEVKSKTALKEASDGMIKEVRTLGSTIMGADWDNLPISMKVDTYGEGSAQMLRYGITPSEMTYGLSPCALIGDKFMVKSTVTLFAQELADIIAKGPEANAPKGFLLKLSIPALLQTVEPFAKDNEDVMPILNAFGKDLKAISSDMSVDGDEVKSSFRIITE